MFTTNRGLVSAVVRKNEISLAYLSTWLGVAPVLRIQMLLWTFWQPYWYTFAGICHWLVTNKRFVSFCRYWKCLWLVRSNFWVKFLCFLFWYSCIAVIVIPVLLPSISVHQLMCFFFKLKGLKHSHLRLETVCEQFLDCLNIYLTKSDMQIRRWAEECASNHADCGNFVALACIEWLWASWEG